MHYIGRRDNPQLAKPYFRVFGKLTKKEAARRERPMYGTMVLTGYATAEQCEAAAAAHEAAGFTVHR